MPGTENLSSLLKNPTPNCPRKARKLPPKRPLTDEDRTVQVSELSQQLPPRPEDGQAPALQLQGLAVGTGRGLGQRRCLPPASSCSATARRQQHHHSPPGRAGARPESLGRREGRLLRHVGRTAAGGPGAVGSATPWTANAHRPFLSTCRRVGATTDDLTAAARL